MSKPDDIPQDVWDAVKDVPGFGGGHEMQGYMQSVRQNAARAVVAERGKGDELASILKDILSALRKDAPGTPLNNHKYDQLGIRAYDAIAHFEGGKQVSGEKAGVKPLGPALPVTAAVGSVVPSGDAVSSPSATGQTP